MAATCFVHIHGRGPKPDATSLQALWLEALRCGLERFRHEHLAAFDRTTHRFVFYGDLTHASLAAADAEFDARLDLEDRRFALDRLKAMKRKAFGSRGGYERLPGRSSFGEFLADAGLPMMRRLNLSDSVLQRVVPDIHRYLLDREGVGHAVRERVLAALEHAFATEHEVIVIAHCLGSVAAFDALWALSRTDAFPWYRGTKVRLLLTLGSPLGDETVKTRLLGSERTGVARFPCNIVQWVNLTAEDDYVSHDNTVADDYRDMLKHRIVSRIDDHRIHNFAIRYGRSNPHSAVGYLIHPKTAQALAMVLDREVIGSS